MSTQEISQADTRVYRVVHEMFRLATTRLVMATETLKPAELQPLIGMHWGFFAAVLDHHHHTEDVTIFPALLAQRPDMAAFMEKLELDHEQLILAVQLADTAVSDFVQRPDERRQRAMHDAIVVVREAFFPHLDAEDEGILPAIATSIPAKVWERMDKEALKTVPRKHLANAVAALDEVIRTLPGTERPVPPPPPIRIMLALSWRRKWSAAMKSLAA
jgi:hemerythrin-like domain-containing protein